MGYSSWSNDANQSERGGTGGVRTCAPVCKCACPCVSMCVSVYVSVCICVHLCMYKCVGLCVCSCVCLCLGVCVSVHVCVCVSMYVSICVSVVGGGQDVSESPKEPVSYMRVGKFEKSGSTHINMLLSDIRVNTSRTGHKSEELQERTCEGLCRL